MIAMVHFSDRGDDTPCHDSSSHIAPSDCAVSHAIAARAGFGPPHMNIAIPNRTIIVDDRPADLEFVVAEQARQVITRLGRTEDLRFSPDFRRLAIAGYGKSMCLVFDIEIVRSAAKPVLHIRDFVELHSPELKEPHGFDFIDNRKLVVANRAGVVTIFDLPVGSGPERVHNLAPSRIISRANFRKRVASPGSVCVSATAKGCCELLVCNNYKHRITRHVVRLDGRWSLPRNSILLEQGLDVPDGIAISPDKAWIAISNHMTHSVLLFDNRTRLDRRSTHVATLSGVNYPHGLRFSPDGSLVYVADAGSPYVHVYRRAGNGWSGEHAPVVSFRVLDDQTFQKGRHNPEEGGPKGLDIDATGELLVVTNEEQPLACFHMPTLLSQKNFAN